MMLAGSLSEYQDVKEGKPSPANEVLDEPNSPEVTEANPISLEEITNVQIDDKPARPIKIIRQKWPKKRKSKQKPNRKH